MIQSTTTSNSASATAASVISGLFRNAATNAATKPNGAGIIGIDLGTTNSCVSVWERGEARVMENSEGSRTTPSVVAFSPSPNSTNLSSIVVGAAAKRQWVTNAQNTIFATKRLIGRRFEDAMVQRQKSVVPYKIVRGPNGDAWVETSDGKQHSTSEIGAHVLAKMKETADRHTHRSQASSTPTRAVITCPAYFNDSQRQATKDAGKIAGLDVLRIINEPTAAALAYGLRSSDNGKVIAVFDLGGGTFDISILEISGGVFEVKATNGDTFLGGEDFDNTLVSYLASEFRKSYPNSASASRLVSLLQQGGISTGTTTADSDARLALQRLREAAERAKCELSSSPIVEINLPFLVSDAHSGTPLHLQTKITRSQFESLTEHLVRRTLGPVRQCLADAKVKPTDINEVVLIGGMTRMPRVVEEVRTAFGKEPFRGVNPDEAVSIGAAVQGGVLEGTVKSVVLLDVTPLSLGIETLGGVFTKLINRNTTIPVRRSQVFSTADDFQSEVEVKVYQGERAMAKDNKLLGSFFLTGIPPLPRGQAQIDVSFDLDANGIVHVRAKDRKSGKEQSIRIEPAGGLSDLEIQKIVNQAEALKEKDANDRAIAEAKNNAETIIRSSLEALREHSSKVTLAASSNVTREIENVKKLIAKSNDADAITRACSTLKDMTMQTFASAFANNDQKPTEAPSTTTTTTNENKEKTQNPNKK